MLLTPAAAVPAFCANNLSLMAESDLFSGLFSLGLRPLLSIEDFLSGNLVLSVASNEGFSGSTFIPEVAAAVGFSCGNLSLVVLVGFSA